jgi:hypothetical protein
LQDPPKFTQIAIFGLKLHIPSGNPDPIERNLPGGRPSCAFFFKQLKAPFTGNETKTYRRNFNRIKDSH